MKGAAWKRYLGAAAVGIAMFLILAVSRGAFAAEDPAEKWGLLCDALFVPGALLTSFGLLLFASRGGVFDMLRFAVQKAMTVMLSKKKRDEMPKTFYDYKMERGEKGEKHMKSTLLVGIAFLLLAGIALMMYGQFAPV